MAMGDWTRGVLTFATQSAGCEEAGGLLAPLLAFHGTRDELLPLVASQAVCSLAGGPTELVVCEGAGHLLSQADELLRSRVQIGRATSELQSLMRISYAVLCLEKKNNIHTLT